MNTQKYTLLLMICIPVVGGAFLPAVADMPMAAAAQPQPRWMQRGLAWPNLTPRLVVPKAAPGPSPQDIGKALKDMLQGMGTSAHRLYTYHAGKQTQVIQKRIIADLETLIAAAKKNPPGGGGGKSKKKNKSQNMSKNNGHPSGGSQSSPTNSPSQAAPHSYNPSGGAINPQTGKPFLSNKSQWGNLPPRARNLILNGIRKSTLPGYQSLVNSYYEALGKLGTGKH